MDTKKLLGKLMRLPEAMECPNCHKQMKLKRDWKAKGKALLGGAATAATAVIPPLAIGIAATTAAKYVYDEKRLIHICEHCGFKYSEDLADKAMRENSCRNNVEIDRTA